MKVKDLIEELDGHDPEAEVTELRTSPARKRSNCLMTTLPPSNR
jgi:hypothetical protein